MGKSWKLSHNFWLGKVIENKIATLFCLKTINYKALQMFD